MGVRGLTTYINQNQGAILEDYLLYDCNLLIDGHSLCAQLYARSRCLSAFGGDYDKFALYIKSFFKSLRKCKVTSYVLFDGSFEKKKLKTAYSRLKSKIYGASRLDPITQSSLKIFPLLFRDVFKEVLSEMQVPFTVCEFEADDEIAAMARYLNCPVLSYDSDFFIYNVLYIPFNTLETKPVSVEAEDGTRINALECRIFKVENLTKYVGGLDPELLPLLATLLGNDYVKKRMFSKFFSQLKMLKGKKNQNEQQRCIHTLFKWLQNESLETAIAKILGRMKKKQKQHILNILKKNLSAYKKKQCRSLKYFNISVEIESDDEDLELPDDIDQVSASENDNTSDVEQDDQQSTDESDSDANNVTESDSNDKDFNEKTENNAKIYTDDNNEDKKYNDSNVDDVGSDTGSNNNNKVRIAQKIPDWFADGIRNGHIPQPYINLYIHRLHFCSPQAEDYNDEDSFICTLPILRYAFDLIHDFSNGSCIYVLRVNRLDYKRFNVSQEYALTKPFETEFSQLSKEEMNKCFDHFLESKMPGLDKTLIAFLPETFQLAMISVMWWVANCNVPVSLVHSFLITFLMLEVIDEKIGTFRGHYFFNNKYSKKIEELKKRNPPNVADEDSGEWFLNKNKVLYEDSLLAASVLLKHFEMDDSLKRKPKGYDHKKMHLFAQLQCCLLQFNCLNTLCRNPYTSTKYSKCFNGTFIYNIALKLENQIDPFNFFKQYIRGADTVLMYYKSLCQVFEKCSEGMNVNTVKWAGKKRSRRKNKKSSLDEELHFIVKGFESEVVL